MAFVREARSVLVIVDLVVDCVDGFLPVYNPEEFVANAAKVREACYHAGIPVVQLQQTYRRDGLNALRGEPRLENGVTPVAMVEGTPGWRIVPELDPGTRDIVVPKSRWHGFFQTELLSILRGLEAEQLVWIGGFTDACLALSVFEGYFHNYPCGLVVDACSCDNEFTHKTAVLTLANWIYDLTIFTAEQFVGWLAGEDAAFWYAGRPNAVPYRSGDDVERLYAQIVTGARAPTPVL
jgi:nicotinamidase-related amidase